MQLEKEYRWNIVDKKLEAPSVYSLFLKADDERPDFIAGQYLTIKLSGLGPAEGKAYSIASSPQDEILQIAVKEMGGFSRALTSLEIGGSVMTSAPYGFFYPETDEKSDLVFVVGGIGITPCISIIKQLHKNSDQRAVRLLYSNQTENDSVFADELRQLSEHYPKLHITHFITRENPKSRGYLHGRMSGERILENIPDAQSADFFLCGSMDFTRCLWKELRDAGIPQTQLYTEGFF